jgi:uncharacterized protein (TIGR00369 family)
MSDNDLFSRLRAYVDSPENPCFVCGQHNPAGLHVHITVNDGVATARWTPSRNHMGWQGVVHGGVLASLLDEAMAYTLFARGIMAVTARMEVRYRSSAQAGEEIVVTARSVSDNRRITDIEAEITAPDRVIAQASARFMKLGPLDPALLLRAPQ